MDNSAVFQLPGSTIGMPSNNLDTVVDLGCDSRGELWAIYNGVGVGSPSRYVEKSPISTFPNGVVGFEWRHTTIT